MGINSHLDPELLSYYTIKFILQPFVENILEHAWYQETMHISIKVYEHEERICLEISDNGIGMSEEVLSQVFIDDEARKGYAIYNVENRIKLQFGDNYGVQLESVLGEGTTVSVLIPFYKDR